MEGIVVVFKEKGYTSRDIVNKLIPIFNTKKIGHTGTLDPIAEGVLVCCIGKYTKLVNELVALDKEYIAKIKLGIKTDTGDITGKVIEESEINLSKEAIINVLKSYIKTYEQTVPKYSAVKVNGKKLYEYARANIDINLPKKKVTIYDIELLDYKNDIITFKTKVSKGTYIRSLIQDICSSLGVLGTMLELTRTKQGKFSLEKAYSLKELSQGNYELLSVLDVLDYPIIYLKDDELKKVKNGVPLLNENNYSDKVLCVKDNICLAIYKKCDDYLKSYIQL